MSRKIGFIKDLELFVDVLCYRTEMLPEWFIGRANLSLPRVTKKNGLFIFKDILFLFYLLFF